MPASSILGLLTSESISSVTSESARREVFYDYPSGGAPLMGLLSLLESEGQDKTTFGWWERRAPKWEGVSAQANSAGPFTNTSDADLTEAGWTVAAGSSVRIYVVDATEFLLRDDVFMYRIPGTSSSFKDLHGRVTAIDTTNNHITVTLLQTVTNALNTTAANGLAINITGSASAEAARAKTGVTMLPAEINNYTQIFRTPFSFAGSEAKQGVRFDSSGMYQTQSNDAGYRHNILLERAAFWGLKKKETSGITNDDSENSVIRHTGGLLWFLKQWELGNVTNSGAFDYRPGGADITASDWTTTDDKRIIQVNGTITGDQFDMLIARVFDKHTSDKGFEKIMFCGSQFLQYFTKYAQRQSLVTRQVHSKGIHGFVVTSWETPSGTILIKTHPLFNQSTDWKRSAFIIDSGDIKYIYQNGRDTNIRPNVQPNDYDGRKDEWFTEAGFEYRYPEGAMFIHNVTGFVL